MQKAEAKGIERSDLTLVRLLPSPPRASSRWMVFFALFGLVLLSTACSVFNPGGLSSGAVKDNSQSALEVLKAYVKAVYPRDYAAAYPLISQADKDVESQADYLRENESLSGFSLELDRNLASYIEYKNLQVAVQGDRATIDVTLAVPDSDD